MSKADDAIRAGAIDPTADRPMPPTDRFTGRTYYALPDAYPFNKEGFVETQAEASKWIVYRGTTDGSEWHLRDGMVLEMWPGGDVFNSHGTFMGSFELTTKRK